MIEKILDKNLASVLLLPSKYLLVCITRIIKLAQMSIAWFRNVVCYSLDKKHSSGMWFAIVCTKAVNPSIRPLSYPIIIYIKIYWQQRILNWIVVRIKGYHKKHSFVTISTAPLLLNHAKWCFVNKWEKSFILII